MDVRVLISKVFERRAVWDKRTKKYSNRNFVDACWGEISKEMGADREYINIYLYSLAT